MPVPVPFETLQAEGIRQAQRQQRLAQTAVAVVGSGLVGSGTVAALAPWKKRPPLSLLQRLDILEKEARTGEDLEELRPFLADLEKQADKLWESALEMDRKIQEAPPEERDALREESEKLLNEYTEASAKLKSTAEAMGIESTWVQRVQKALGRFASSAQQHLSQARQTFGDKNFAGPAALAAALVSGTAWHRRRGRKTERHEGPAESDALGMDSDDDYQAEIEADYRRYLQESQDKRTLLREAFEIGKDLLEAAKKQRGATDFPKLKEKLWAQTKDLWTRVGVEEREFFVAIDQVPGDRYTKSKLLNAFKALYDNQNEAIPAIPAYG